MVAAKKSLCFSLDEINPGFFQNTSCAFGVFDGVHRGHQYLIDQTIASAKKDHGSSVILTFDKDPDEVFSPDSFMKLMTNEDRINTLAGLGADSLVILPFTTSLSSLDPIAFLDQLFCGAAPTHLHIGNGFRFGRGAKGTTDTLNMWGKSHNMEVHEHNLLRAKGQPISSTRIRSLLRSGELEEARELLGNIQ